MPLTETDQQRRAVVFRELHESGEAFVIPNAWDAGTARLFSRLGFPALATTSAGLAFGVGRSDGANRLTRAETLQNAGEIVAATALPVSADLESGYGETTEQVAATIRAAAQVGLVGGSIEDATGNATDPLYSLDDAVDRVAAAAEVARSLPFPFTLTARAENFLYGRPDLDDVIRRLQAYESAGADVLYAPGLPDLDAVRAVCAAVTRPVNVLVGGAGTGFTVMNLTAAGVRRISFGSALTRLALAAAERAARQALTDGTFDALAEAIPYGRLNTLMAQARDDGGGR